MFGGSKSHITPVKSGLTSSDISIIEAYFEAEFIKNISIFEPQIVKQYAYSKKKCNTDQF